MFFPTMFNLHLSLTSSLPFIYFSNLRGTHVHSPLTLDQPYPTPYLFMSVPELDLRRLSSTFTSVRDTTCDNIFRFSTEFFGGILLSR